MQNNRVVNVANPVNPQDAVTLGFLNTRLVGSGAQGTMSGGLNPAIGSGTVAWKVGVSPWAKIAATNGQLTISAGGTNQSIILSPSGAGGVQVSGLGESSNTSAMLQVNGLIRATDYNTPTTGTGVDIFYAPFASPWGGVRCYDYGLGTFKELDVDGSPLILNGYSGKSVGVGTSPPNSVYRLDVNGPINCGGGAVYFCQGSGGQTTTVRYGKSNVGTIVTYGTMTFLGGILVGVT
jgi:hypothetical protein